MAKKTRPKVVKTIRTPFKFEKDFTPEEFQKLGQLALRWAHIEHVIGNCLKAALGLSDNQAEAVVSPMGLETRLNTLNQLLKTAAPSNADADLFLELTWSVKAVNFTRNNVFHGVLMQDEITGSLKQFELRSKKRRRIAMTQILELENITNYAAHAALLSRHALGGKRPEDAPPPLPDRPEIPSNLPLGFPMPPVQKAEVLKHQRKSSRP